jgi:hypothetical protein
MTGEPAVVRPARLMAVVYGLWAAVLAIGGPQAQVLPSAPQAAAGLAVTGLCFYAAVRPVPGLRLAYVSVAGYAMWNTARVVADQSYSAATALAGASTYLTVAAAALTTEAMTAVLQGIDEAAKDSERDE